MSDTKSKGLEPVCFAKITQVLMTDTSPRLSLNSPTGWENTTRPNMSLPWQNSSEPVFWLSETWMTPQNICQLNSLSSPLMKSTEIPKQPSICSAADIVGQAFEMLNS